MNDTNKPALPEPDAYLQIGMEGSPSEGDRIARIHLPKHYDKTWWRFEPLYTRAALSEQPAPPTTPNAALPPLGDGQRKKISVTVEVPENWAQRLDMQWVLEREIHADRWSWNWPQPEARGQAVTINTKPALPGPVAFIDKADFDTLRDDGWCVVHAAQCDPGADHCADEPLYTRAAIDAAVAEARAVPEGWTDADADAARLALELECLLTDKDVPMPALSRWWDSAHEALRLHRERLAATPSPAAQPKDAVLSKVASIAHAGGLVGLSEHEALVAIRRLTLGHYDRTETMEQATASVRAALSGEQP